MEKSQVVIFGGDYSFNAPAFTLMGQTMESVDRYKYLGLWFHESLGRPNGPRAPSRPPKSVASEYLQQRFIESETIQHTLFECEAFEEEREAFLARLYSVCPPARQLTDEGRCRLVMGDELPREIENPLYRYLTAISRLRLGILTEQGEGS